VISALRNQRSKGVTSPTPVQPPSTSIEHHTAPTSKWTTDFGTLTSLESNSFKCLDTGCVTDIIPNNLVSGQTRLLRRGALLPRSTFWKDSLTPENRQAPQAKISTRVSPACSATTHTKTPRPSKKKLSH
jgi:hypothetical protein